jgi:hypothetical protein
MWIGCLFLLCVFSLFGHSGLLSWPIALPWCKSRVDASQPYNLPLTVYYTHQSPLSNSIISLSSLDKGQLIARHISPACHPLTLLFPSSDMPPFPYGRGTISPAILAQPFSPQPRLLSQQHIVLYPAMDRKSLIDIFPVLSRIYCDSIPPYTTQMLPNVFLPADYNRKYMHNHHIHITEITYMCYSHVPSV